MDAIAEHAAEQAERPALITGDRTITWREFSDLRNRLGHSLVQGGLMPGEHVVIYSPNCPLGGPRVPRLICGFV